jgi:DnaJ-class molecular chaperone
VKQPERRNLYRILYVQPEAPAAVIKASYRALMSTLRIHPDLGGDHEQAARINHAYEVLSDPQRRKAYDQSLRRPRTEARVASAPANHLRPLFRLPRRRLQG